MSGSSTVAVGSEIYFIGGSYKPCSSDLWILDTRSGEFPQGPSMKVARTYQAFAEEIDGKIYVIGGCEDEIQVEVFDPKSRNWNIAESPQKKLPQSRLFKPLSASLNRKVYMVQIGYIAVYDPRQGGRRLKKLEIPSDIVWFCFALD